MTESIVLTANGVWLSNGTEIEHESTRQAFAKNIHRDAEGYFISFGRESKRIHVEDTAYFVHRIDRLPDGAIDLWLSDETRELLSPTTLTYRPGRLTCRIKGSSEEAKFLQIAYMDLLLGLEESPTEYFLSFPGVRITLAAKSAF